MYTRGRGMCEPLDVGHSFITAQYTIFSKQMLWMDHVQEGCVVVDDIKWREQSRSAQSWSITRGSKISTNKWGRTRKWIERDGLPNTLRPRVMNVTSAHVLWLDMKIPRPMVVYYTP